MTYCFDMIRTGTRSIVVLAMVAAATAACSSGNSAKTSTTPQAGPSRTCTANDVTVSGAAGTQPTITIPTNCAPPQQLLTRDLIVGTSPTVAVGDIVTTQYVLVTWSNGQEVDSSWSRGEPFVVQNIGHAQVIEGWNQGIIGMKQGGRRLLIVPPAEGYGPTGTGGIKGGETLAFVIDAVKVTAP